jgi:asparagine synthase (glutamine-hydrolysing)
MFFSQHKPGLYTPEFWQAVQNIRPEESFIAAYQNSDGRNDLERMLFVDQKTHLLDEYLVKVDRLSMAHSLEVRVPLLDPAVVEFAAEIPAKYKLRGFTTKYLLRRLMKDRLPREVLAGAKKGFSPPLAQWLSQDLRDWARERLSPDNVRKTGLLRPEAPGALLQEHVDLKHDHSRRLWTLLSFLLWFEKYGS